MKMIGIRSVENSSYLVGHFQAWYFNGKWKGIEIEDEEKINYMDFILENKGILLLDTGFYGIVGEEKIFDLSSYLFERAIIVSGKKKKNLEGKFKSNPNIPLRIIRVIAKRKGEIEAIARIFELPLK